MQSQTIQHPSNHVCSHSGKDHDIAPESLRPDFHMACSDKIVHSHDQEPRRLWRQAGQAMTEYLIILALIAVAAIAVYQSFGKVIRAQTAGLARELAGESSSQAVSAARSASSEAMKQKQTKTLKSYGTENR